MRLVKCKSEEYIGDGRNGTYISEPLHNELFSILNLFSSFLFRVFLHSFNFFRFSYFSVGCISTLNSLIFPSFTPSFSPSYTSLFVQIFFLFFLILQFQCA